MGTDSITAKQIRDISFTEAVRGGYDRDQVDEILSKAAATIEALESDKQSASELLEEAASDRSVEIEELKSQIVKLTAERDELKQMASASSDEANAISQALIAAQRTGNEIVKQSREKAQQLRDDATESASNIIASANAERDDINAQIVDIIKQRETTRENFLTLIEQAMADLQTIHDTYSVVATPSTESMNAMGVDAGKYTWSELETTHQVDKFGNGDMTVKVAEDIEKFTIDGEEEFEPSDEAAGDDDTNTDGEFDKVNYNLSNNPM